MRLKSLLQHKAVIPALYAFATIFISIQAIIISASFAQGHYTDYNNYIIFRNSFRHLLAGTNLYQLYPAEHWDYYKYSPTFALLMAPFSVLPDYLGLSLWNLLNAFALFFAVKTLPPTVGEKRFLLLFVLVELITSMQNAQSNGLLVGLMIAVFNCLHDGKQGWAALWLVAATFVKVYGAVAFCFFLFFPGRVRFILRCVLFAILFVIVPVIIVAPSALVWQYQNWVSLMIADVSASYGISVMGVAHAWLAIENNIGISLMGVLLFLIPLSFIHLYSNKTYHLNMLAFTLIWVILFNSKAESPTYIIAITGIAIWYFAGKTTIWQTILLILAFIFTCLSPTDIFSEKIRQDYFESYAVKAIPCIIIWVIILLQMTAMALKHKRGRSQTQASC